MPRSVLAGTDYCVDSCRSRFYHTRVFPAARIGRLFLFRKRARRRRIALENCKLSRKRGAASRSPDVGPLSHPPRENSSDGAMNHDGCRSGRVSRQPEQRAMTAASEDDGCKGDCSLTPLTSRFGTFASSSFLHAFYLFLIFICTCNEYFIRL